MSRDASISCDWADGEHRFRLAIGGLRELQEKLGCSPFRVFERLRAGEPMVDDAREVLRIGLIGGGMEPVPALDLVRRYADERPLAEGRTTAVLVLGAALFGVPDEQPGKPEGAGSAPAASPPTDESGSPPSTASAP